jgi:hypothetical protein
MHAFRSDTLPKLTVLGRYSPPCPVTGKGSQGVSVFGAQLLNALSG